MADEADTRSRKRSEVPKWLRKIQEASWEAEILISFGALIVLFQLPEYLFLLSTSMDTTMGLSKMSVIPAFANLPLIILIIGFICHLIVRGFWAGMIAMNFSFPDGVNKEKLVWNGRFSKSLKNIRENTKVILDLEKLAGTIFGFTFLMFFTVIAIIIWFMIGIVFPLRILGLSSVQSTGIFESVMRIGVLIYYILFSLGSLVYLIDFLTLGWLKRKRRFSIIYYPFYRFLSLISLSHLSKNLYYTLVTNISKKRLFGVILGLTLVLVLVAFLTQESFSGRSKFNPTENSFDPNSYGTLDDWNFKRATRISKRITDNGFLEIYWLYDVNEEDSLKAFCLTNDIIEDSLDLETIPYAVKQKCLDQFYNIYFDDTIKAEVNWEFFTYKKKAFPFYIMTAGIDASKLQNGQHFISFKRAKNIGTNKRKIAFYVRGND